ncbi:hypothetical protein V8E36_006095 [Tilletia maclaganii]
MAKSAPSAPTVATAPPTAVTASIKAVSQRATTSLPDADSAPSSTPFLASSQPTGTGPMLTHTQKAIIIACGTIIGVLILLLIGGFMYACSRRRHKQASSKGGSTIGSGTSSLDVPPTGHEWSRHIDMPRFS